MNALALKVFGGVVALGTLGTGTYFGVKELLRVTTIKEKLISQNFKFIDFRNVGQWDLEYESDIANIKQLFGNAIDSGIKLRDKCEALKSLDSVSNEKNIDGVKKYCGIRKISSQLERKNKKYLVSLDESVEEVANKWKATYDKRKTDKTNRSKLGLEGDWPTNDKDEMAEFKKLCENKGSSEYLFNAKEIYTVVENWCTVDAASVTITS